MRVWLGSRVLVVGVPRFAVPLGCGGLRRQVSARGRLAALQESASVSGEIGIPSRSQMYMRLYAALAQKYI